MMFYEFENRTEASVEAARRLRIALERRLASDERTNCVVSGGSTPAECFAALSKMPLPWNRVSVSLTDERCVPVSHDASNEGMLRKLLLNHYAAAASIMKVGELNLASLAVSLIGMGQDGHFASIFPDNPQLESLLNIDAEPVSSAVVTGVSEFRRITLNLSFLLNSDRIVLLIFGGAKRELVLNPGSLPVGALLNQDRTPVDVVWAP